MYKADDGFDEGDRYAKRLLNRSQYSDCHSPSYYRRLNVIEALSKSSMNPLAYDGNPFEKEFSDANKASDDQLEMTFVSTWPEGNADLSIRAYDVEPPDSLFCANSLDAKATNRLAAEYRSSNQFPTDIGDSDAESVTALTNSKLSESHDRTLSIGERFGPLTPNELIMQGVLNMKYEKEFEQCNAQMQLQGLDEFFGTGIIEVCEPKIIEFHRKSHDSVVFETQTQETEHTYAIKKDTSKGWIEKDLKLHTPNMSYSSDLIEGRAEMDLNPSSWPSPNIPGGNAAQTDTTGLTHTKKNKGKDTDSNTELSSSSIGSEEMKNLDREIDYLEVEDDSDSTNKTTSSVKKISATFEILSAKKTNDNVNGKESRERSYVLSIGQPRNSPMENVDGNNPLSPKNTTFLMSTTLDNSTRQQRGSTPSKTASFIKRHTSFLFKNLRTPKLVRCRSSVESTKKMPNKATSSSWLQANARSLTRSSTIDSSDKLATKFQQQIKHMQTDFTPVMDDTVDSEMESFLKVALASDQYNSTMAQTNCGARDLTYSVSSNNATYTESNNDRTKRKQTGTLNRTRSIYKTLTKKIRDKFRKYDQTDGNLDVVSNFNEDVIPEDLNLEMKEYVKQLQDKANIQNTLIHQTSKALQLCDSMPEFTASPERVEYERLLLISILTKNVVLREVDRLIDQKTRNSNDDYTYTERGEVTLKDIRMQLREDILRRERQNGDIVDWFVVIVMQGVTIWATHAIACPTSSPQIYFPGAHTISGLTPDFRLSIKVYSMKLQQLKLFNHDDKYHITRSYACDSGNKIKTSKMLRKKPVSPKQHKVKYTGIRETSFIYCGGVDLMLYDLKLRSPWPLNALSPNTVLHGTIDLNFSCKLELSMFHAGFLTHCEETGDLAWNRRWCLLEGHKLLFWNYPREQEFNPPMYIIDLVNCVSDTIEIVDRRLCPKPRTLLLETKSKTNEKNHIVIESRPNGPVTRHLLSYDDNNELADWHSNLNHVISALSDWNIIQTQ